MSGTTKFTSFLPSLNRILIKRFEPVTKTKSGIILTEPTDKTLYGEVIETGPGMYEKGKLVPLCVKKGDTVLLPEYSGQPIKLKEGEFHIYRDHDIMGILKK